MNSWPDNVSLDKARRLLWPLKQKYGRKISWADLIIFAGNCAYESMGLKTFGFGFGREDIWEPEEIFFGEEEAWLGTDRRYSGDRDLANPFGATTMGLIYVNPEGPEGQPDPAAAAKDIRETFGRMAMNDEETAALIVGGHSVGKTHGAGDGDLVGPEPEGCPLELQGLGWKSSFGTGVGKDAITSGLEVVWTPTPTTWDNTFLEMLYGYEWELTKSPGGAWQFTAKDGAGAGTIPDPFDGPARTPTMLVTDITMRVDPIYGEITRRWLDHPEELSEAFAKAWYKLLHRDMGPLSRYLGPWVAEPQLWQDPVPAVDHALVTDEDVKALKAKILDSGLSVSQLVSAAWASAASFRGTDLRGGANGARIRLAPQKAWEVNKTADLDAVLPALEKIQSDFNGSASGGKKISLADLIVLGGSAAIEKAATGRRARHHGAVCAGAHGRLAGTDRCGDVRRARTKGRRLPQLPEGRREAPAEHLLVDRAYMLNLTAPEMTVLIGGLRVLGNGKTKHGVFTDRPGMLTNDFFVNLLDMGTAWKVSESTENVYAGQRPRHGRAEVDRDRCGSGLRFQLHPAFAGRGLRHRRCEGQVRGGVRQGVGQGDEQRSVRSLILDNLLRHPAS